MVNITKTPYLDVFKSELVRGARFSDFYEFPMLAKSDAVPQNLIPFDRINNADKRQWVHFYIHDCKFERIWNNPKRYLDKLKSFDGVITPDFSLYWDMPLVMQMWNTYRSRAIGYWLQSNGVNVIPNIRWGDERTREFVFDSIEVGGTVAVSTYGCIQNKIQRKNFKDGLAVMVDKLHPKTIINYSYTPDDIFSIYKQQGIHIVGFENYAATQEKAVRL
ncbi:hypothetical protein FACS1894188_01390 [Clostridia bacterium]|nr:hypothetical protein FACS1894188_01390 [Clostridia bacterium]